MRRKIYRKKIIRWHLILLIELLRACELNIYIFLLFLQHPSSNRKLSKDDKEKLKKEREEKRLMEKEKKELQKKKEKEEKEKQRKEEKVYILRFFLSLYIQNIVMNS